MTTDQAVDIVRETLYFMLLLSTPILGAGLAIGLLVSVMQAVTQVQEQTLSFVPKIIVMGLVTMLITPWLGQMIREFSARMFGGE